LVSRAHTASDAGPRVSRVRIRYCRVNDVLHDQHVAALERRVEVLEDPHDAGRVGRGAVRRHRHEVDLARDGDLAHEVGEEEHRALEHADQQQVAPGVVARDLLPELADAVLELVGLDQDLADGLVARHGRAA
jgi:hypothetical protein